MADPIAYVPNADYTANASKRAGARSAVGMFRFHLDWAGDPAGEIGRCHAQKRARVERMVQKFHIRRRTLQSSPREVFEHVTLGEYGEKVRSRCRYAR
jgi:hypothetical protein